MKLVQRIVGLMLILSMFVVVRPQAIAAQEALDTQCFDVPGIDNCLDGKFLDYWRTNGGLPVFGYPITGVADEVNQDTGETYPTQWLERNRFELHAENAGTPYETLLGLLGKERLAQLGRGADARAAGPEEGCLWFEETGHNVCNQSGNLGFKTYWETHGLKIDGLDSYAQSLQLFGLPLTAPQMETNSSGDTVMTQWFERARFEWHPNNPDEFKVLLGLLGKEVRDGGQPAPAPEPAPAPAPEDPCADVPEPVSARVRPAKCGTEGTVFFMDVFGFKANEQVGFWLTAPNGAVVGTVETVNIGPNGGVNGIDFDTDGAQPGIWQWTFEGVDSKHQSIVYIKVLDQAGGQPAPAPAPAPAPSDPCADVPEPVSARVRPSKCGVEGTVFSMDIFGFKANEEVGFWLTNPNGAVVGTVDTVNIGPNGGVNGVIFDTDGAQPGIWQWTFEGVDSKHQSIIYIKITN